jgi:hypothetical protein
MPKNYIVKTKKFQKKTSSLPPPKDDSESDSDLDTNMESSISLDTFKSLLQSYKPSQELQHFMNGILSSSQQSKKHTINERIRDDDDDDEDYEPSSKKIIPKDFEKFKEHPRRSSRLQLVESKKKSQSIKHEDEDEDEEMTGKQRYQQNDDNDDDVEMSKSKNIPKIRVRLIQEDDDDDDDDYDDNEDGNPYSLENIPNLKELTPQLLEYLKSMPKLLGGDVSIGDDIEKFKNLPKKEQKDILKQLRKLIKERAMNEHPYFKIMKAPIDSRSKAVALEKQASLLYGDSMGDQAKVSQWIQGFLSIPFGEYRNLPKKAMKHPGIFLQEADDILDSCVYGLKDAKDHILRYIAQLITNPEGTGNCLVIEGPPGTGKTSLIQNGISKILNRPFHFISLGGATDSSILDGHSYTYEGSMWGQIVDILIRSKCMNPIIYFDELDKVSDTPKGEEIIGVLTHLTDSTQNTHFMDKYFSGISLDLSRVLFIFSLNHLEKLNPILRDRLRIIHTKGYDIKEKRIIGEKYLIPQILKQYKFESIKLSEEAWSWILNDRKEPGVRELKRDLETIISRLNVLQILRGIREKKEENTQSQMYCPKNLIVPNVIDWDCSKVLTKDQAEALLKDRIRKDDIPAGMYL